MGQIKNIKLHIVTDIKNYVLVMVEDKEENLMGETWTYY